MHLRARATEPTTSGPYSSPQKRTSARLSAAQNAETSSDWSVGSSSTAPPSPSTPIAPRGKRPEKGNFVEMVDNGSDGDESGSSTATTSKYGGNGDRKPLELSSDGVKRNFFNILSGNFDFASSEGEEVDIMCEDRPEQLQLIEDRTLQGFLSEGEADNSFTSPQDADRKLFESALARADQDQGLRLTSSNHAYNPVRPARNSKPAQQPPLQQQVRGKGKELFNVLKQRTRGRASNSSPSIKRVYFGTDVAITPWYSAPYPSEYHSDSGELWICEFCLKYMKRPGTAQRHLTKCHGTLPPGDEIYRDPTANISVFEINGREAKLYCQNLCLLAKMFLDHKTLYYDVDPFLFYVLVEWRPLGTGRYLSSFVGYFSKEKVNPAGYNVSCILTMPHHQRKGYGSFLIDFSYLLSRREGRLGSPEKPLSDLGLFSYVSYWKARLLAHLSSNLPDDLSKLAASDPTPALAVERICRATGMTANDVLATLEYLRMLRFDPVNDSSTGRLRLRVCILLDVAAVENWRARCAARAPLSAHDKYLRWQPYKCTQ